ncbi:MAG: hypothetical protein KC776_42455, partial [Myxococcales bacterium]|nr:hypothetical protein [Myxococcales bacterium]
GGELGVSMALALYGFSEAMRGTWTPDDGSGRRVFWFELEADATDAVAYLRRGSMRLVGTVFAEGLAEHAPGTGTLEVRPLGGRIGYDIEFRGPEGERYRFSGHKSPTWRHPLKSMTTLPGVITDGDGNRLGSALVRFNLVRDLVPFLRTFRAARPALLEAT